MKFGMPTLVECRDIYECVEVAKTNGLDFVEINMSFPQYQPHSLNIDRLKRLAQDNNIFYTIHADEQFNPFDFNPAVSKCYFENMREAIRLALALDIPVINMHLLKGVYVTLPEKVILLTDVYSDEYISAVKRFIAMCEQEIGDKALNIVIENVDTNPFTESQVKALKLFMASPRFGLTLDVGHMECLGMRDEYVFEQYGNKLVHLHLHDSDGKHAHLPLGEGVVDIADKINRLNTVIPVLLRLRLLTD